MKAEEVLQLGNDINTVAALFTVLSVVEKAKKLLPTGEVLLTVKVNDGKLNPQVNVPSSVLSQALNTEFELIGGKLETSGIDMGDIIQRMNQNLDTIYNQQTK